jgi:hypothetical protein
VEKHRLQEYIQEQTKKCPYHSPRTTVFRGVMIGRIDDAIRGVLEELHVPASHGVTRQVRAVRLDLASYILERKVRSYNDLSDAELWAIGQLTRHRGAWLTEWVRQAYGVQLPLV